MLYNSAKLNDLNKNYNYEKNNIINSSIDITNFS